jgi:hypothetical protein
MVNSDVTMAVAYQKTKNVTVIQIVDTAKTKLMKYVVSTIITRHTYFGGSYGLFQLIGSWFL